MNWWNYGMLSLPNSVYLSWNWSFSQSILFLFQTSLFIVDEAQSDFEVTPDAFMTKATPCPSELPYSGRKSRYRRCCIFWPAFGYWALQTMFKIWFFMFFTNICLILILKWWKMGDAKATSTYFIGPIM